MTEPVITLKNLKRYYHMGDNTVKALDGIDLEIQRGEFVTIVGSSGSGKSTLMNILGALDSPDEGDYILADDSVAGLSDDELSALRSKRIGFVFQQFHLLHNLSVSENIALSLAYCGIESQERAQVAQKMSGRFGMSERLDHKPFELSGGQQQRVAIMRALSNTPDILLLDEPTGALDSATGTEIMEIFHELHRAGLTIIMVTHDRELAEEGTRCINMRDGRIIEDRPSKRIEDAARESTADINSSLITDKALSTKSELVETGLGLKDLLRIGWREGVLAHKLRSALTMLGIIIGVSAVIAMSAFSLGSKQQQLDQIRKLGANQINIVDLQLENERLHDARKRGSLGLARSDAEALLSSVKEIKNLALRRNVAVAVRNNERVLDAHVMGVNPAYFDVNGLMLGSGRLLHVGDDERRERVAVVGAALRDEFALHDSVYLNGNPYVVVGFIDGDKEGLGGTEMDGVVDNSRGIFIPLNSALYRTPWLALRSEIDAIQLELFHEDDLVSVRDQSQTLLLAAHKGIEDFRMIVPLHLIQHKQEAARLLDVLTLCISSIALVVGGIGIMNIMLASVSERMKEIGIRRAIGARQSDIRWQFLGESLLLSLTGGLIGVIVAVVLVVVIASILGMPVRFSVMMSSIAVIASLATGLIFGWYPARQAARKEIVEVLRHD